MRWLNGIIDSKDMSSSKLWELVRVGEAHQPILNLTIKLADSKNEIHPQGLCPPTQGWLFIHFRRKNIHILLTLSNKLA